MPKILLTAFFSVISTFAFSQAWEIGAGAGGAGYMGDLNQHNPLNVSGISLNGFVKYNFNGYFSVKGLLNYGKISADDSKSSNPQFQQRNLNFYNQIIETSAIAEFNFMHYIPDAGKNKFTPFVYLGFGVTPHAPRARYGNDQTVGLRPLQTEGQTRAYAKYIAAIPFGAGFKYNIGGKFSLIGDIGYRYTNTDYLDDVSGMYANPSILKNNMSIMFADRSVGQTAVPGTQRGDMRKRDTYMFFNLSISYTFVTQKCYFQ